ncbi:MULTISPECIES: hypothetical protein [unclassified Coleofasciculus]|nr:MULTISPECIES: hypothetical protein [unclassified Coleofasciculus]MBD1878204.1 hypothetical protein [Coleofasciculus sp. FACHB-T130]MBD1898856.1 hypothetical protein [Coleofasciculus sp. FACHB-125]
MLFSPERAVNIWLDSDPGVSVAQHWHPNQSVVAQDGSPECESSYDS